MYSLCRNCGTKSFKIEKAIRLNSFCMIFLYYSEVFLPRHVPDLEGVGTSFTHVPLPLFDL